MGRRVGHDGEEGVRHMPESDVHHFSFLIMHERLMHLRHTPNVVPLQSGEGHRGKPNI